MEEKLHSEGVRGSTSDKVREMADKLKVEDINTLERVDVDQPHYNVMFSGGWDSVSLIIRHLEKGEAVIPFISSLTRNGFQLRNLQLTYFERFMELNYLMVYTLCLDLCTVEVMKS